MELLTEEQLQYVKRKYYLEYGLESAILLWANCYGHLEIVKLLLQDSRVNPADNNNESIRLASHNGHLEIVKLLLKDKRVNPADNNNESIRLASHNGHLEIVKLLLQDNRVNPANNNNYAIIIASKKGHLEIVKLLLKDPRVNPDYQNNYAIILASRNNKLEIVKLLLQDTRVIENGNLEEVKKKYPFEYIYYKNLKNRKANVIQKWYTRKLYNPNSNYIRNYISKF